MTEIFRRLYRSMIEELQKELGSANNAYTALAEQVALSFHKGSELTQEEFDRLAGEFHQILVKLLNHLNLLYPGQVQIFPLAAIKDLPRQTVAVKPQAVEIREMGTDIPFPADLLIDFLHFRRAPVKDGAAAIL